MITFILNTLQAQTNDIGDQNVRLFVDGGIDGSGDLTSVVFKESLPITVGDVYLYKNWNKYANLISKTEKTYKIKGINYNIEEDSFQIKISTDSVFTLDRNYIKTIEIDNSIFTQLDTVINSNGFYEVLFLGKEVSLLKKHNVRLILGNLNPLDGSIEANRYHKQVKYYIKKDNSLMRIKTKKKYLLSLFKGQEKTINTFIKSESLSVKDQKDLIKTLKYIDSLYTENI